MCSFRTIVIGVGLVVAAAGCGARTVPTAGVVTLDGKPLANATVMFVPDAPDGKTATGFTDAHGAFALTTMKLRDGALPGSYKVTVIHSEPIDVPPSKSPDEAKAAIAKALESRKPSEVPALYGKLNETPLKHRVPDDGDATFKLSRTPQ